MSARYHAAITHESNALSRVAKVDEESLAERVDGQGKVEDPLESPSASNDVPNNDEPHSIDHVRRVADVPRLRDGHIKDDLQQRREVCSPAGSRNEVHEAEAAPADEGAICQ